MSLLDHLNHENVNYCIVGDSRGLPEEIEGDVDMVVSPSQLHSLIQSLGQIHRHLPMRIVQVLQHEQKAFFLILASEQDGKLTAKFLHPDICSDYYRNGRLIMPAEKLLKDALTAPGKNFRIPSAVGNFSYYLIKRVGKNSLGEKQKSYLDNLYRENPSLSDEVIARYWPGQSGILIREALQSGTWNAVEGCLPHLQVQLRKTCPFSLKTLLGELFRRLRRWLQPTGFWVVFLGADGSGKSSVISEVQQQVGPAFRKSAFYHLRPGTMHRGFVTEPVMDPYGKKPRTPIASTLKLAAFWLDYWVGFFSRLRPALVRTSFISFDRHLIDMAIDPYRYRYSGSVGLVRLACRLIPQPDLFVLLDAPTEVMQARKQEVSWDETEKQRQAYLRWAQQEPACRVVDASAPLGKVVADVNHLILSRLAEKTRQRMGWRDD